MKSRKSGDAIPNFVHELDKLLYAEGLSSALKEKKKRLAGQLIVYNKKREEKGLAPIKCNPIRIGDELVEEKHGRDNDQIIDGSIPSTSLRSSSPRRVFGMSHLALEGEDKNQEQKPKPYISSKVAFGITSESRPVLKAEIPAFVPSIAIQRKDVQSKSEEDLEYIAFLKSLEVEGNDN